jgi:hypothetical protein
MAATYEPIATTTLGSAASSITFSSIPATYSDIRLVLTAKDATGSGYVKLTFNNDTGTNYSRTLIYGDGSAAGSASNTNQAFIRMNSGLSTTIPELLTADIFSYAGSTYKTALVTANEDKNGSGLIYSIVGLWRSTSAINRIDLSNSVNNFAIGTTATLYGIKAA